MIKISVTNNAGLSFGNVVQTQELADAWIAEQVNLNSWGKPDRWLSFVGEPDAGYTDTRIVAGPGGDITEYFYPVEYTIVKEDVSLEYAQIAERNKVIADKAFGNLIADDLKASVRMKNEMNVITDAQQLAIVEDSEVIAIERHLTQGYLKTAKDKILSGTLSMFTQEEKSAIVDKINQYLGA